MQDEFLPTAGHPMEAPAPSSVSWLARNRRWAVLALCAVLARLAHGTFVLVFTSLASRPSPSLEAAASVSSLLTTAITVLCLLFSAPAAMSTPTRSARLYMVLLALATLWGSHPRHA